MAGAPAPHVAGRRGRILGPAAARRFGRGPRAGGEIYRRRRGRGRGGICRRGEAGVTAGFAGGEAGAAAGWGEIRRSCEAGAAAGWGEAEEG
jgi:hypothetical protein